ncbi:LCP family protein required for cell wall assembly [Motilibacter peucedani]|uniref:LCP family protein required for cell wall assembly n=1 Tax=Motilibacter peucedani TaxID=598650 RepID=A0A420XLR1_9ACTN|nr:LCP family protein [Motilibacter peucedani]RKS71464.1 LCP family protein required for cell wall assembly [Motilibacter peucedani]
MRRSEFRRPYARHARAKAAWKRALVALTSALALLAVSAGGAAAIYYKRLGDNIHQVQIADKLGPESERPQNKPSVTAAESGKSHTGAPIDILVMGSDTRAGDNGFVGGDEQDGRSDTTILLHISADRQAAYGISVPRDSMVQIPDCISTTTGKNYHTGTNLHMFNEAYTIGGAACTVKTFEKATGIRIEHYVVVDFHGFNAMVSALHGVEVCVPQSLDDDTHNIHLRAGRNTIKGKEALDYVRARYRLGDGTDVGRTERQQYFIAAMIRKALKQGLTRPDRLLRFLDAATSSLQSDMKIGTLRSLGQDVAGIGLSNIVFTTIPTMPWPQDKNRLVWTSQADTVWGAIADDRDLPGVKRHRSATATPTPTPSSTPLPVVRTAPSAVRVRVVDGTGSQAHAEQVAADLRLQGFQVVATTVGDDSSVTQTTVRYDPAYDQSARTLSSSVPGSVQEKAPELSRTLELVVGSDYAGTTEVRVARATSTPKPSSSPLVLRTALSDGCKAS